MNTLNTPGRLAALALATLCMAGTALAQATIDEAYPTTGIKTLKMAFEYPKKVTVTTGTGNQVLVRGTARINNGMNDEAFAVSATTSGSTLEITSHIAGLDKLPRTMAIHKNGETYHFNTTDWDSPALKAFVEQHGKEWDYTQKGVIKEIELAITVPKGMPVEVETGHGQLSLSGLHSAVTARSRHGLIESRDSHGPLSATSQHGGVDVTLRAQAGYEVTARTRHGQLYANLPLKPDPMAAAHGHHRWQAAIATINGGGTKVAVESQHGNVYLRQEE